jgi:hypothetical protein
MSLAALLVAVSCLSSGCGARQRDPGTADAPEQLPRTETGCRVVAWNTEMDLGFLPPSGSAEGVFRIENQGDSDVLLHLGSPTCRCSEARIEKETLRPGESTNVRMLMRSRPFQAGPADARVFVEADGGRWAEMLSVHAVELGANFPAYSYVIGGSTPVRKCASVGGDVYLKTSQALAKVDVPLVGTGLEPILAIRDARVGPPVEGPGCVRRECSFTIELKSQKSFVAERREVELPVLVTIDGETSRHRVRLTILPSGRFVTSRARQSP